MYKRSNCITHILEVARKRYQQNPDALPEDLPGSESHSVQKKRVTAHTPAAPVPDSAPDVAEYTIAAIRLHEKAIPHSTISRIDLRFYRDADFEEVQPQIDLFFDGGVYPIDIGMFWADSLGLDRDGRKNCQTMAESIWSEYRMEGLDGIDALAEAVRTTVAATYPHAQVTCEIQE